MLEMSLSHLMQSIGPWTEGGTGAFIRVSLGCSALCGKPSRVVSCWAAAESRYAPTGRRHAAALSRTVVTLVACVSSSSGARASSAPQRRSESGCNSVLSPSTVPK